MFQQINTNTIDITTNIPITNVDSIQNLIILTPGAK